MHLIGTVKYVQQVSMARFMIVHVWLSYGVYVYIKIHSDRMRCTTNILSSVSVATFCTQTHLI